MFPYSPREVEVNCTNELYVTDVYNLMGVIKGSTHPGMYLSCSSWVKINRQNSAQHFFLRGALFWPNHFTSRQWEESSATQGAQFLTGKGVCSLPMCPSSVGQHHRFECGNAEACIVSHRRWLLFLRIAWDTPDLLKLLSRLDLTSTRFFFKFFADELVLLDSYWDAWVYGTADPSSGGTAAMM